MDTDAVVVARQQNQRHQNINAPLLLPMVLRYLPKFSSTSLEALLVEEFIQKKEKAEKVNFYLRHKF